MLKQGKSVRSLPPEGQGAADTACDELTTTLIPCTPVLLRAGRQRNESEVQPRKKGGVGRRCFNLCICFSLSYTDLIADELNSLFSPSPVCFVHDSNW